MATTEAMNVAERYKYLRIQQAAYQAARTRQEKQALLDELERITGLHRKYLIPLMSAVIQRRPRQRERRRVYGPEVDAALRLLWQAQHYICAERVTPNLVFTAELLVRHGAMQLPPALKAQLETISVAPVRRHLPASAPGQPRRAQQRLQNSLQRQIPAGAIPWDTQAPGHCELDLVFHCGAHSDGQFVDTLQIIGVAAAPFSAAVTASSPLPCTPASPNCPFPYCSSSQITVPSSATITFGASAPSTIRTSSLAAVVPATPPTIASSNRRIVPACAPSWVTGGSIPSPRPAISTNSTPRWIATTTAANPCCTRLRSAGSPPRMATPATSAAFTIPRVRPSPGCVTPNYSPRLNNRRCSPSRPPSIRWRCSATLKRAGTLSSPTRVPKPKPRNPQCL